MLLWHLPIIAASTSLTTIYNQLPLRSPKTQNDISGMLYSYLFPQCGMDCVFQSLVYQYGQYTPKKPECTSIGMLRLRVRYLNATIIRTTQKPAPEIGPHGSYETKTYLPVDGCRSMFGLVGHPTNNLHIVDVLGDLYSA
jgi:hypothetical protein